MPDPVTQPTQTEQSFESPLAGYGRPIRSEVLDWLPMLLGLCSAAVAAFAMCPVPLKARSLTTITAVLVSLLYVLAILATATTTLVVMNRIVGLYAGRRNFAHLMAPFCDLVAWGAPVACFLARGSFWAVMASVILAAKLAAVILSWRRETEDYHAPRGEHGPGEDAKLQTEFLMIVAALLLHFAVASAAGGLTRLTSGFAAVAVFQIVWRRDEVPRYRGNWPTLWRASAGAALAVISVCVSMTPYLAVEPATSQHEMRAEDGLGAKSPQGARPTESQSLIQRLYSFVGNADAGPHGKQGREDRNPEMASASRPYPILQALFGDQPFAPPRSASRPGTAAVPGESYSGMILRPEIPEHIILVPPLPRRRVFGGNPSERRADALSIPFYGAYWFFRTAEKTLPPDAVQSRGDPASIEFRTTDLTPITMEARQNFGREIEVSCCQTIEIHISNGDRRPNTVAIELVLMNTRLRGQPTQSLGVQPVISTLGWYPGDRRPPVPEILSFRVPSRSAIREFDEAIIRFHLNLRKRHSAKIGIQKFRLIPRRW